MGDSIKWDSSKTFEENQKDTSEKKSALDIERNEKFMFGKSISVALDGPGRTLEESNQMRHA